MAMAAFDDPDGILDGTDPVPEDEPVAGPVAPSIHKVVLEPGEKVDDPWRPGDPLDLPTEGRPKSAGPRELGSLLGGRTPEEIVAAFPKIPKWNHEPTHTDPPPPEDPVADRLDYLRYLARWCGPTAYAQAAYDQIKQIVDAWADNNPKSKKVPPAQLALLAKKRQTLDDCLERDRVQAGQPEGCHCLGTGGYDGQLVITLWSDTDPPVLVYSEGLNGPMTWSRTCSFCPEGKAHLAWAAVQRSAMHIRRQVKISRRILGIANIPERYKDLTLATYPDQVAAGKVQSWYLRVIGEIPTPASANLRRSLLIHGPNRRGKTGLAIGVQKLAIERDILAVFRPLRDLLADLKRAFGKDRDTSFDDVLDALRSAPLLIMDDLGAERLTRGDTWIAEVLYGLLDHRCNANLPTIITSNLGWSETDEARRRRSLDGGSLEDKAWKSSDYDPEELLRYVGERLWWRIDSMSNKLPLFGPVLGYDDVTTPVTPDPSDEL